MIIQIPMSLNRDHIRSLSMTLLPTALIVQYGGSRAPNRRRSNITIYYTKIGCDEQWLVADTVPSIRTYPVVFFFFWAFAF